MFNRIYSTSRRPMLTITCVLGLIASMGCSEADVEYSNVNADLDELMSIQADNSTVFVDRKEFETSLESLWSEFNQTTDKTVNDGDFEQAFDRFVLGRLGSVNIGEERILDANIVARNWEALSKADSSIEEQDVVSNSHALTASSVPRPLVWMRQGYYLVGGKSTCRMYDTGSSTQMNVLECGGETAVFLSPPWTSMRFSIRADHVSSRSVVFRFSGENGAYDDSSARGYALVKVRLDLEPNAREEAQRFANNAHSAKSIYQTSGIISPLSGPFQSFSFHAVDLGSRRFRFTSSTFGADAVGKDWRWNGLGQDFEVPWVHDGQCAGTSGVWQGCRGTGCAVCAELIDDYPLYFINHPNCARNDTCAGRFYTCNANCPAPTSADR